MSIDRLKGERGGERRRPANCEREGNWECIAGYGVESKNLQT